MRLKLRALFLLLSLQIIDNVTGDNEKRDYLLKHTEVFLKLSNFSTTLLFKFKDADVSEECGRALGLFGAAFGRLDEWALKMFDATSKLQSGILSGNFFNLGDYDECQSIKDVEATLGEPGDEDDGQGMSMVINGQHCMGQLMLALPGSEEKLPLTWSTCAPDACSAGDLNAISALLDLPLSFVDGNCHNPKQDPEVTTGDYALVACFVLILVIMFVSSAYDYYLRHTQKEVAHPLLLAFSVVTNGEKLFAVRRPGGNTDQMECLSGIRSLSMMWVVIGHMFSNMAMIPVYNVFNILSFFDDNWTMYVRGATVAVDSFFLMAGVVMIYVYLKSTKGSQCLNVPLYYLHRYLRLTPALAAVLAVHLTVLKHFGAGPLWPVMNGYALDNCKTYWWSLLLYIQNYVNPYSMCLGQSWYLSVDTQLFFISPIFLLPLKRYPRYTLIFVVLAAMASVSSGFAMAWIYKLYDINTLEKTDEDTQKYITKFYTATYARAAPWLIGILVGYAVYQIKMIRKHIEINRLVNLLLWCASLIVLATCVFYDSSKGEYDRLAMSSYIAFVRPAWSLALAWVIFACVTGYGGPINSFLSMPIFQVLARLTYSMYLTHFTIILVLYCSTKHPLEFSNARIMYDFWSTFALVLAISIVWTLAFESPVIIIEKCLLGGGAKREPEMKSDPSKVDDSEREKRVDAYESGRNGIANNGYVRDENAQNGGPTMA